MPVTLDDLEWVRAPNDVGVLETYRAVYTESIEGDAVQEYNLFIEKRASDNRPDITFWDARLDIHFDDVRRSERHPLNRHEAMEAALELLNDYLEEW